MSSPDDRCARPGCGLSARVHGTTAPGGGVGHDFDPHPIQRGDEKCNHAVGVCVGHTAENGAKEWIMDDRPIEDEPLQRGEEMGTTGGNGPAPHAFVLATVTVPVGYLLCAFPGCGLRSVAPIHLPVGAQPDPDAAVRAIFSRHQYRQGPWDADKCAEDGEESGTLCLAPRAAHTFEPQTPREREAFAAGRALGRDEGAREEREAIRKLVADFDEDVDFDGQELLDDINIEIARRGSVPK